MYTALVDATLLGIPSAHQKFLASNITLSPSIVTTGARISFRVVKNTVVKIAVYNLEGNLVKSIYQEAVFPGEHSFNTDLQDLSSGMYLCEMVAGNERNTIKFFVMKE
ncbi:MAG: T9SS type A sorting domain-containing protein [Bacteroidetes bacterium]|nr:T9SS type A sorting domain-containing protein [Bacteroidota bacterium]